LTFLPRPGYDIGMSIAGQITTAEQLLQAPDMGRCELLRGELIMMSPAGFEHGRIAAVLGAALTGFVRQRGLGVVTGAETGFQIGRNPDTVRAPDAAFVRAERAPAERTRGFFDGAPDLAVEILSPSDRASEVNAKVQEWLGAGCRMVWVVDPETRTVAVWRGRNEIAVFGAADVLSGSDVLPGFSMPVADIFA
jgi:Uma2 family endonuclease